MWQPCMYVQEWRDCDDRIADQLCIADDVTNQTLVTQDDQIYYCSLAINVFNASNMVETAEMPNTSDTVLFLLFAPVINRQM